MYNYKIGYICFFATFFCCAYIIYWYVIWFIPLFPYNTFVKVLITYCFYCSCLNEVGVPVILGEISWIGEWADNKYSSCLLIGWLILENWELKQIAYRKTKLHIGYWYKLELSFNGIFLPYFCGAYQRFFRESRDCPWQFSAKLVDDSMQGPEAVMVLGPCGDRDYPDFPTVLGVVEFEDYIPWCFRTARATPSWGCR